MSSHEHNTTPEQSKRWETPLSLEGLLVGVLERKVIPADDPDYPEGDVFTRSIRYFKARNGDKVCAWGDQGRDDEGNIEYSRWVVSITPAPKDNGTESPSTTRPYCLFIGGPALDPEGDYQVIPDGSEIPLPPEAVEALLGTVATMSPVTKTEYGMFSQFAT